MMAANLCQGPCVHEQEADGDEDEDYVDRPQTFYLRWHDNWDTAKAFPLRTPGHIMQRYSFSSEEVKRFMRESTLRSEPNYHIYIPGCDNKVSKRHAEIVVDTLRGKAFLRDLGGPYGTWLNGRKLFPYQKYQLSCGDVLSLGESVSTNNLYDIENKNNVFVFNLGHAPRGQFLPVSQTDLSRWNWRVDENHMPELVENVALYLDLDSLKNLRLVNRFWGREATRMISKRRPTIRGYSRIDAYGAANYIKQQFLFNSQFVETFGSRDRLFNPGVDYVIKYCTEPGHQYPRLLQETLWLYTTFLRGVGIFLTSMTVVLYNLKDEGYLEFFQPILEQHAQTLEELSLVIHLDDQDHLTTPIFPNAVILPFVKKARVALVYHEEFEDDDFEEEEIDASILQQVTQLGKDLVTILPNVKTITLASYSFPPVLEKILLRSPPRKLSCLNLEYNDRPKMHDFVHNSSPIMLTRMSFEYDEALFQYGNQQPRMTHLTNLLTRASASLEELKLNFTLRGNERRLDQVQLRIPPMPKLKKLTLVVTDDGYHGVGSGPCSVKTTWHSIRGNQDDIPLSLAHSFPHLEELDILQREGKVDWTKMNWTPVMEAFFPNTLEIRSSTLKWICLPRLDNFQLGDYGLSLEILKGQFPNLKKIFDQNNRDIM